MSRKVSKLEITDICDELSEDLRRELIERQVICVSKFDSNRNEFNELKNDIKRLESDLKFANKCLITLNKFKKYLNEIRPQIENVLDLRQKQELNALENEYKIMIKKINRRTKTSSDNGSDSEVEIQDMVTETIESDHNYNIKKEIPETNGYSNTEECMAGLLQCDYSGCRRTFSFTEDLHKHRKSCHSLERDHNSNDSHSGNIDPNDNYSNDCNYEPISEDNYSSSDEINDQNNKIVKTEENSRYVCDWAECKFVGENLQKLYIHKNKSHKSTEFKCKLCDYRCKHYSQLNNHKMSKHSSLKCPYAGCGLGFTTAYQRTIHIKRYHKNLHKYHCTECLYTADCPSKLKRHQKRVHKWFKCDWPQCGFFASSVNKLKVHKYRHTGVRPFPCTWPQCEQSFHSKSSLTRHLKGHKNYEKHNKSNNNPKDSLQDKGFPVDCPVKGCGKRFATKNILRKHLIYSQNHFEFDPNLKLKCNECPFRCDSQKWLKSHMRVHSNELFECQFCKKEFTLKFSFINHQKTVHSFVETFKCTVEGCDKDFNTELRRSQHLCRDHKIAKTFPCDYIGCGFMANTKTDLEDHKCIHTGQVPFACDRVGCDYVGQSRKQLQSHNNEKHKNYVNCDLCDFRSKSKKILKIHKITKHTTDTPFKCEYCDKRFKLKSLLKGHTERVHLMLELKCTYAGCDQVFDTPHKRYTHIQVVHIKKHRCDWPECDFIAVCRSKLVKHKYIHTGQTPFVCDWPECGFIARNKDNLKHHRYRHTGERPYPCTWPGCGKSFRTDATQVTHMRWHKNEKCYSCEWPGCEFATHDRSHLRNHKFSHQKNMTAKTKTNKRLKVVIKTNNISIKKTSNKRNARKPKEPKTEPKTEPKSDSGSDYSD